MSGVESGYEIEKDPPMNIEKIFKRIIILDFILAFILPFFGGIIAESLYPSPEEINFGNIEILLLILTVVYIVNLYFLYTFKPIGKTIYVPLLCIGYGLIFFTPLEVFATTHLSYFFETATGIISGIIIGMIYFTDIKEKFKN